MLTQCDMELFTRGHDGNKPEHVLLERHHQHSKSHLGWANLPRSCSLTAALAASRCPGIIARTKKC